MSTIAWQISAPEPAIAPHIPIIDAHMHFFEDGFLVDMFGRMMPEEFVSEIDKGGHNVAATVYVEALWRYRTWGPESLRRVGEIETVEAIARYYDKRPDGASKLCAGIVGSANLDVGEAIVPILEAQIEASPTRFCGVRDSLMSDPSLERAHIRMPMDASRQPEFRKAFAHLQPLGLSFDACILHTQVDQLVELARAFPETTIICNHVATPLGVGRFEGKRAEVFAEWKKGMIELGKCENIIMKLGGLGFRWVNLDLSGAKLPPNSERLAQAFEPYINHAIDAFSPERCMFESNFPVDGETFGYGTMWNAFKRVVQAFSHEEQLAMFYGTAKRAYKLDHLE